MSTLNLKSNDKKTFTIIQPKLLRLDPKSELLHPKLESKNSFNSVKQTTNKEVNEKDFNNQSDYYENYLIKEKNINLGTKTNRFSQYEFPNNQVQEMSDNKYKTENVNYDNKYNTGTIKMSNNKIQLHNPFSVFNTNKSSNIYTKENFNQKYKDINSDKVKLDITNEDRIPTENKDFKDIYYNNSKDLFYKGTLADKVIHFHQDPYHFLDFIVEKYYEKYLSHININSFNQPTKDSLIEEIKMSIKESIFVEINKNMPNLIPKTEPKATIKEEIIQIENKKTVNENKKYEEGLISEPVDQNELLSKFLNTNNKSNELDYNSKINFKSDIYSQCLNNQSNRFSNYDMKLTREILYCLKGEKVVPPTKRFYSVYDLKDVKEMEETKNLLNIKKQFMDINKGFESEVIKNIDKSIKQDEKIYQEYLSSTSNMLKEMELKLKDSDKLMERIFIRLDQQFEQKLVNRGLDELSLVNTNLEKIKQDILKDEQYIEHHKERLGLVLETTSKINKKVDEVLKENGMYEDYKDTIPEGDLNYNYDKEYSLLNESEIDRLYNEYNDYSNRGEDNNTYEVKTKKAFSKQTSKSKTKKYALESYSKFPQNTNINKVNHKYLKSTDFTNPFVGKPISKIKSNNKSNHNKNSIIKGKIQVETKKDMVF